MVEAVENGVFSWRREGRCLTGQMKMSGERCRSFQGSVLSLSPGRATQIGVTPAGHQEGPAPV